jgi:hypothetical protein
MQSSFTDDVIDTITSKTDESRDLNVGQTGSATGATEADSVILPPEISGEKPTAN